MPAVEKTCPVLPLRDIVVFPHMIVPLFVGRDKSVRALDEVSAKDKQIVLLTQKDASLDDPTPQDMYEVGTLGVIVQLLRLPDGTVKALIEGQERVKINRFIDNPNYYEASVSVLKETGRVTDSVQALVRSLMNRFEEYVKLNKKLPPEILMSIGQIDDPHKLADVIASHFSLKIPERQKLLETVNLTARLEQLFALVESEIGVLQVEKKLRRRVKRQMEKSQRDYYLNEQMKAIQKELGDDDNSAEMDELADKIEKAHMSAEAKEKATSELKKLRMMSPMSSEATVIRNYLDVCLELPWGTYTKERLNVDAARKVLDRDHFGLEKVKERILETIAVRQMNPEGKGQIICLAGPPGVGKTSIALSVAKALNRKLSRISLGGVRDEADIRGHRKTYIGAMPGRIVEAISRSGAMNPLLVLDEIDKLASDMRGDPASALLELSLIHI